MTSHQTFNLLAALAALAACSSNAREGGISPADQLVINFESGGDHVRITLRNTGDTPIKLIDAEFASSNWPPTNVDIRAASSEREIIGNQAHDPDGWWSPHFVRSDIQFVPAGMREPPYQTIVLEPGEVFPIETDFITLMRGMRPEGVPLHGDCRVQVRIQQRIVQEEPTTHEVLSSWIPIACDQIT